MTHRIIIEIQILLEIAMSIGNRLDLTEMLKESIQSYLRKLDLSGGAVFRMEETQSGELEFKNIFSIPGRIDRNTTYQKVVAGLPEKTKKEALGAFLEKLPIIQEHNKMAYAVCNLPGFGLLVLIGTGDRIGSNLMKSLQPMNNKLANACIACTQNARLKEEITRRECSETEQKNLQEQLEHSRKLESIGTLAGGIAHDFNNILTGILGYSQLAKYDFENPKDVLQDIDQIEKAAHRATLLVQQILTFSRQSENTMQPLKIKTTIEEVIKLIRSSIPATIEIKKNINSNSTILSDPTKLHQVIMNLCTNAYHAMRDLGGTLTVELHDVEIASEQSLPDLNRNEGAYVKLVVKDTGHGIDKETQAKIFDPYFTTKEIGKGTGLGLSVVDGIVKSQNGFIKIRSKIDQGTTFEVFWPKIESEINDFNSKLKTNLVMGSGHLMLVDDEITILQSLKKILEKNGYQTTCFSDSPSALLAFEQNPDRFDAVITDMTMPKITGDRLSMEILKIRKNTPIILCSGYNENLDEEKAHNIGIKIFVRKPIQVRDFLKLLNETLS